MTIAYIVIISVIVVALIISELDYQHTKRMIELIEKTDAKIETLEYQIKEIKERNVKSIYRNEWKL